MAIGRLSPEEQLLKWLRQPRSTQSCREHMDCKSIETESILELMRDERIIAYANGEWYVIDGGRLPRVRKPAPVDPRQRKLFDD